MNSEDYAMLRISQDALIERFNKFESDFLKTDGLTVRLHPRKDLNAFLLLHQLAPEDNGGDMISNVHDEEIYLEVNVVTLNKNASDEDIQNLVRCGVMYHAEYDCLYMFA